jgi:hypothetical protein
MLYLRLIILLVGDDVSIDNETLLVTDFINLKIKLTRSFRDAHMNRICVHVFIEMSAHTYINICVRFFSYSNFCFFLTSNASTFPPFFATTSNASYNMKTGGNQNHKLSYYLLNDLLGVIY